MTEHRTDPDRVAPGADGARHVPRKTALWLCSIIAVLMLLAGSVNWLARNYESGKARDLPVAQSAYADLHWPTLIPKGWDPMQRYRNLPFGALDDSDPKARALLQQMRETWDNAPINTDLDGARVRILGYVVPLEANKGELREFLLVPYAGACIHTPPPPANQIIHVALASAIKDVRTMDTVRVSGTLRTARRDSPMGVSGYTLQAVHAEKRKVIAW